MTCIYSKIYGDRASGVGYLAKLVERNFITHCLHGNAELDRKVVRAVLREEKPLNKAVRARELEEQNRERILYSEFGPSTGAPPLDIVRSAPHAQTTLFLMLTKHPVFHVASLYERHKIEKGEFALPIEVFLNTPIALSPQDNLKATEVPNPVAMWNVKTKAMLQTLDIIPNGLHIKYEDLLAGFSSEMDRIAEYLPRSGGQYSNIRRSTKGRDPRELPDYIAHYKLDNLAHQFPERVLASIYVRADLKLLKKIGYPAEL